MRPVRGEPHPVDCACQVCEKWDRIDTWREREAAFRAWCWMAATLGVVAFFFVVLSKVTS